MTSPRPRYDKAEFARRGREIFDHDIQPCLTSSDDGAFVAIDIETCAFELDRDDRAATDKLVARIPDAQIWLARVGHRATYRLGGRPLNESAR